MAPQAEYVNCLIEKTMFRKIPDSPFTDEDWLYVVSPPVREERDIASTTQRNQPESN